MNLFTKLLSVPEKKEKQVKENFWKIPELKELSDETQIYESHDGLRIKINKELYSYEEPLLTEQEKRMYTKIERGLYEIINLTEESNPEEKLKKTILLLIAELNLKLDKSAYNKIYYHFKKNFLGFGKMEAIRRDPLVTKMLYIGEQITLKHSVFGICKTDISLTKEESEAILRKAMASCNRELLHSEEKIFCQNAFLRWEISFKEEQVSFSCEKKREKYKTPEDLVKEKKVSPEILAYLWMLLEDKRSIFIQNDKDIVYALSFFLPAHVTVKTNTEEYPINQNTRTIIGESLEKEDFAFLINWIPQNKEEVCIAHTAENLQAMENVLCYTESGIVKSIQEYGKELFTWEEGTFLFSLGESMYIASKGNKIILLEEFRIRTKLIQVLLKNHLKEQDFKKVIAAYYENSQLVLKKAGIQ